MSAEAELYATLTGAAAVTALLAERIYPEEAPVGITRPYAVYQRISTEADAAHDHASLSAVRLDGARFQITIIADTQLACISALHQVRLVLERSAILKGVMLDERTVARDQAAQAYGQQGDFLIWSNPE